MSSCILWRSIICLSVNVEALAVAEAAETESVLARIDQRSRDTESEQDETSTVLSVGSQGSRSNRCHPSKHHRQGQQYGAHRNHHSRRRHLVANRSDSIGAVSCDSWSGASDANNHVVSHRISHPMQYVATRVGIKGYASQTRIRRHKGFWFRGPESHAFLCDSVRWERSLRRKVKRPKIK